MSAATTRPSLCIKALIVILTSLRNQNQTPHIFLVSLPTPVLTGHPLLVEHKFVLARDVLLTLIINESSRSQQQFLLKCLLYLMKYF